MEALLITILVTLFSDVYLQGSGTVELRKEKNNFKYRFIGNLIHFMQIFIPVTIVIGILYSKYIGFGKVLYYTSIISIIHILIDIIKCWLIIIINNENKIKIIRKYNLYDDKKIVNIQLGEDLLFILDQILHLAVTIFICTNSKLNNLVSISFINQQLFYRIILFIIIFIYTARCGELYIDILFKRVFKDIDNQYSKENKKEESILLLNQLVNSIDRAIACFALNNGETLCEDSSFNREIIETATTEEDEEDEVKKKKESISRYIGILERSITIILVIGNNYSSIVLILTGKSLARMGEFKDKEFAVKFIVGTFFSILIGIVGGESFKFILNNFIK